MGKTLSWNDPWPFDLNQSPFLQVATAYLRILLLMLTRLPHTTLNITLSANLLQVSLVGCGLTTCACPYMYLLRWWSFVSNVGPCFSFFFFSSCRFSSSSPNLNLQNKTTSSSSNQSRKMENQSSTTLGTCKESVPNSFTWPTKVATLSLSSTLMCTWPFDKVTLIFPCTLFNIDDSMRREK